MSAEDGQGIGSWGWDEGQGSEVQVRCVQQFLRLGFAMMVLRGGWMVLALCGSLLVGVVTAQELENRMDGLGFALSSGSKIPSSMKLEFREVDGSYFRDVSPDMKESTVFTSGLLKRESDPVMSKVLPGYDTTWGKQFVFDDPKFQGSITFVEASSNEIGVHLKISRSDYYLQLTYFGYAAHTLRNEMHDLASQSNVGTPGEHVFVVSGGSEHFLYGPTSPVAYSNYHAVAYPRSPLQEVIKPRIAGVPLDYRGDEPGLTGHYFGVLDDGREFGDYRHLSIDGGLLRKQGHAPAPGYVSRSSGREDMEYIASLTSVISSSYVPVQALFAQLFEITPEPVTLEGFEFDLQLIYAVDNAGRPAMILNVGELRDDTTSPRDLTIRFLSERYLEQDLEVIYRHSREINLGRDFDRKSNVGIPGTWVFVVSEEFTDLLDSRPSLSNPSLYKFCSQDSVETVLEANSITERSYLNLESLGWTGKWRKKSLGYLVRRDRVTTLSHFRRSQLKRGGVALRYHGRYELEMHVLSDGSKMNLKRICVVGDPDAMEKIARDTAAAGLDDSVVPEKALVFEYEIRREGRPGKPSYTIEQVFASFPDRETIAAIANFPPADVDRLHSQVYAGTQCGYRSVNLTNEMSNTEEDGRFVVVFDSSENYGTIHPAEADILEDFECDDYAGPCDGECPAGFQCQVHNSRNFCINCHVFRRVDEYETDCCAFDSVSNQCTNGLRGGLRKCFVADPDGFQMINGEDLALPVSHPASVCKNHRNFLQNGAGCLLKDTFNAKGNRRCYFPKGRFF